VVRENENAGHLDLLGGSCLMLARAAAAADPPERGKLAPRVRELAGALDELAREPGDRPTRQRAADRSLDVARGLVNAEAEPGSLNDAAILSVRMVATDVMVFAGVDTGQAKAAVREGTAELEVPDPPSAPRLPFKSRRLG
jgi:hypothetical protein